MLNALVKVSIPVHLRSLWRPRLKDSADEMVLETAVNGGADLLVTFNLRHLAGAGRERLQASILEEARRVSETEGVALNQFINVAVAEKLSAVRTEDFFRERAGRGNLAKARRLLKRAGRANPPLPGDELG